MTENRELGTYVHDAGVLGQMSAAMTKDYNSFAPYAASTLLPNTAAVRP